MTLVEWPPDSAALRMRGDGSVVAAHYGSVATELAICRKTAGLADRSELGQLQLTGREPWIEHALAHAIGEAVPAPGRAAVLGDTWCCRLAADRALVAAPPAALARWRRLAREAVVAGHPITCADLTARTGAVSIVGPSAGRVLRAAGLPYELSPGELAAGELSGVGTTVLRDARDHFLLLFSARLSGAVWSELMDAGRPLGLSLVGSDALGRLRAVPLAAPRIDSPGKRP
jgi:glycine cleavage system aminomethyltransferase T